MRVKVQKNKSSNDKMINANMETYLKPNEEYLVLGLYIDKEPYVYIYEDGHLFPVPLDLFEIIDNRISKYWIIKNYKDGSIVIQPKEFFRDFFHDDLLEGNEQSVKVFNRIKNEMEKEFDSF